jgi:hypothetical protein
VTGGGEDHAFLVKREQWQPRRARICIIRVIRGLKKQSHAFPCSVLVVKQSIPIPIAIPIPIWMKP